MFSVELYARVRYACIVEGLSKREVARASAYTATRCPRCWRTQCRRATGGASRRCGQSAHRGIGWEHLHVAIDDAARLAYSEILPDEKKASAVAFLVRALLFFDTHGVRVERVMTDNGAAYRSHAFRDRAAASLRHFRTRPSTPRTNGKAERFIQTALREWAYGRPYHPSAERCQAIDPWLHHYNHHRPHAGIKAQTPAQRGPPP